MELNKREMYFSPGCESLELRLEGVIAASGDPQEYDNPFGDELIF